MRDSLSKLSRAQLLQLLREAVEENERLHKELDEAQRQLADKTITIQQSGSIAEAALGLSGVFAAAQNAVDLYNSNVSAEEAVASEADSDSNTVEESAELDAPAAVEADNAAEANVDAVEEPNSVETEADRISSAKHAR